MGAVQELEQLRERVANAQQLANMGDYDWHIPSDTNRWSDQLYRIYGYDPQTVSMGYETFLSHVHPDDREKIAAIHQHAYATGEPYEMVERIVRPDGEVRYLSSNGQVLMDDGGAPMRMRGTCIDVTDQVLAEQGREKAAMRLGQEQLRRQKYVEINDHVVQGLTAALYAMELGEIERCQELLERTVSAARDIMTDLVAPLEGEEAEPGDLVRSTPASLGLDDGANRARPSSATG